MRKETLSQTDSPLLTIGSAPRLGLCLGKRRDGWHTQGSATITTKLRGRRVRLSIRKTRKNIADRIRGNSADIHADDFRLRRYRIAP